MSSEFKQCTAITDLGTRCTRKVEINSEYCWQHNKIKIEQELIPQLSENILSEYIEYDELKELENQFEGLKIDPSRVQIKEYIIIEEDQQIKVIETYIDNNLRKKDEFYENGNKMSENNYNKNEYPEGKQYEWYPNGILQFEFNYKNENFEGKQYFFGPDKILQWEKNYKNGKYDGSQFFFYPDGNLEKKENYKNGKKEGVQYFYNKNGELEKEENYKNGYLIK